MWNKYSGFLLACVAFILTPQFLVAQNDENVRFARIRLLAKASKDSIVLRWAPTTPGGWRIANTIGYVVERMTVDKKSGEEKTQYQLLTKQPLKPRALEEWKQYAGASNDFSAIAAQAVYGKAFTPQAGSQKGIAELRSAADELLNRYSFALYAADNDAVTAHALGLRFVDKQITPGERYVYRVYVAQKTPDYAFDTSYVLIDAVNTPAVDAPLGFRFESGDGLIKLYWDMIEAQQFSGYSVYRSTDGKNFTRLNTTPLVHLLPAEGNSQSSPCYIDTGTINYRKYYYRVVGITPFAEMSKPAELIAFSRDLTPPPAPTLNKPQQLSTTRIKLTWEQPSFSPDFKGFVLLRKESAYDEFQIITKQPLPAKQREYIDSFTDTDEAFYTVAALDTAGNYAFSLPVYIAIVDSVPPPAPKGLRGRVNTDGKVILWWKPVPKRNIRGYRVLRANDPTHEFTQITNTIYPDTIFVDSLELRTLTKKVYYRVAAVDKHYQHSSPSEMLVLQKPDVVPPLPPVFGEVVVTDSTVHLTWKASPSSDVARQLLLRREETSAQWRTLDTLNARRTSYTDKKIVQNTRYLYTIVCIDSSGLHSEEALPVAARPFDSGKRDPVTNFVARYDKKTKTITLSWNYQPRKKELYWFMLYKAFEGKPLSEYTSVPGDTKTFRDGTPSAGITTYGIVVITANGGQSEMVTTKVAVQ